jgi:hypothetical protein
MDPLDTTTADGAAGLSHYARVRETSAVIDDECWNRVWAEMTDSQAGNDVEQRIPPAFEKDCGPPTLRRAAARGKETAEIRAVEVTSRQ